MKTSKIISVGVLLVFLFSFIGCVSAITGSMGNARMVLRVETGDIIEKYILVKNVNDVPITINLEANGDLADDIKIQDSDFVLEPGTEKKAYFTIKVKKQGTTESKIDVKFTPEEGNGIGLSSTVIVIAKEGEGWWEEDEVDEVDEVDVEDSGVSVMSGNVVGAGGKNKMSKVKLGLLITSGVFLVFLISMVVLFKKTKNGIELQGKPKKSVAGKSKKKVKRDE